MEPPYKFLEDIILSPGIIKGCKAKSCAACPVEQATAALPLSKYAKRSSSTDTGVVVDDDSRSVSRVLLSLSGPAGTAIVVSDEQGRFIFTNLIPGRYLIRTHLNS